MIYNQKTMSFSKLIILINLTIYSSYRLYEARNVNTQTLIPK